MNGIEGLLVSFFDGGDFTMSQEITFSYIVHKLKAHIPIYKRCLINVFDKGKKAVNILSVKHSAQ